MFDCPIESTKCGFIICLGNLDVNILVLTSLPMVDLNGGDCTLLGTFGCQHQEAELP